MSLRDLRFAQDKYSIGEELLKRCFEDSQFENNLNLREFLEDSQYVIYEGMHIKPNMIAWIQVDSSTVPEKWLKESIELEEALEDAKAWLRIWNNVCDRIEDFIIGLPGESNVFDSELKQSTWEEIKQGEAFADMEGRIFAYKLLKGEI